MLLYFRNKATGESPAMEKFHKSYYLKEKELVAGCGFYLLHTGYLHTGKNTFYRFGGYNCWHVVAQGEGLVKCGGKIFHLKKGDLFSVMYGSQIEYGPLPETEWEFYYLRVEGPRCDELTRRMGLTPDHPVRFGGGETLVRLFRDVWSRKIRHQQYPMPIWWKKPESCWKAPWDFIIMSMNYVPHCM